MNCFTFVYGYLLSKGVYLPSSWEEYTKQDMRIFVSKYKWFLQNKMHYKFFESFCSYVDTAKENDIIIDDNGVAVAINKFKCYGIFKKKPTIMDIDKNKKILRIN